MVEANLKVFRGISRERLNEILSAIQGVKIGLIGDMCLDVYWSADMTRSELSRETPHFPLPVIEERMSPGAGGNVAANIAALNVEKVNVLGVVGKDWRGSSLINEFHKRNINTDKLVITDKRITNAYCKSLRKGISDVEYEDPRIDFDNFQPLCQEDEQKLLDTLEHIASEVNVLCVSDQFKFGCITAAVRSKIIELARQGLTVIVDSRDRIGLYTDVILKPNELECYRAVFNDGDARNAPFERQVEAAKTLSELNKSRVCMTLGSKGCVIADTLNEPTLVHIPSRKVEPPIDIVGAGDTFLSAFSCAIAAGASAFEAAAFANLASGVTIKKIGTTGVASPEELRESHMQGSNDK